MDNNEPCFERIPYIIGITFISYSVLNRIGPLDLWDLLYVRMDCLGHKTTRWIVCVGVSRPHRDLISLTHFRCVTLNWSSKIRKLYCYPSCFLNLNVSCLINSYYHIDWHYLGKLDWWYDTKSLIVSRERSPRTKRPNHEYRLTS